VVPVLNREDASNAPENRETFPTWNAAESAVINPSPKKYVVAEADDFIVALTGRSFSLISVIR
jgi:hypothetical protein